MLQLLIDELQMSAGKVSIWEDSFAVGCTSITGVHPGQLILIAKWDEESRHFDLSQASCWSLQESREKEKVDN